MFCGSCGEPGSAEYKGLSREGADGVAKSREGSGLERRKLMRGLRLGTLRGSHSLR